jgi:HEAT repeat protein
LIRPLGSLIIRAVEGSRTLAWRVRKAGRLLVALVLAAGVLASAPRGSIADDDSTSFRDLATASDYRVRVAAALALGKSKSPGARPALEKALGDAHPAVRSAAAAALGSLGDARALPALKSALDKEDTPDVRASIDRTMKRLSTGSANPVPGAGPAQSKAKFLVSVGKLENRSGVSAASSTLKTSTRTRMAQVPGVEVLADGADAAAEGRSRNLPTFTVDGSLTRLDKQQGKDNIGYQAKVEYLVRKLPDQKLTGTLRGSAAAFADTKEVHGDGELVQLQSDAIAAAVDSALKGVSPALEAGK